MLQRIGRYEVLERIASGGQGTVYRARDTVLDRVVAVKVINQSIAEDPAYLEALQREARLAAGLDHPFITTVYDSQVEDGTPYIVMEYVPDALDRHMQDGRRLPWQRAAEITVQIARALQHAHDNGMVHRDIKPQNILLREDGSVAVSDYGIARALASSTRSRTSSVMGTPAYMSPEQWASGSLDGRIDQYALGIVFFEMLAGSTPSLDTCIGVFGWTPDRHSRPTWFSTYPGITWLTNGSAGFDGANGFRINAEYFGFQLGLNTLTATVTNPNSGQLLTAEMELTFDSSVSYGCP